VADGCNFLGELLEPLLNDLAVVVVNLVHPLL
jgi:hypothetical protein